MKASNIRQIGTFYLKILHFLLNSEICHNNLFSRIPIAITATCGMLSH
jgi:hypothetical protein